jgi:hypothetical protein
MFRYYAVNVFLTIILIAHSYAVWSGLTNGYTLEYYHVAGFISIITMFAYNWTSKPRSK